MTDKAPETKVEDEVAKAGEGATNKEEGGEGMYNNVQTIEAKGGQARSYRRMNAI